MWTFLSSIHLPQFQSESDYLTHLYGLFMLWIEMPKARADSKFHKPNNELFI